jgi:hypothetical protein
MPGCLSIVGVDKVGSAGLGGQNIATHSTRAEKTPQFVCSAFSRPVALNADTCGSEAIHEM